MTTSSGVPCPFTRVGAASGAGGAASPPSGAGGDASSPASSPETGLDPASSPVASGLPDERGPAPASLLESSPATSLPPECGGVLVETGGVVASWFPQAGASVASTRAKTDEPRRMTVSSARPERKEAPDRVRVLQEVAVVAHDRSADRAP